MGNAGLSDGGLKMFLAVTFVCLISGECDFIVDHTLTTKAECELRNEMVAQRFNSDDNVSAFRTICIAIPNQFNARHSF